MSNAKEPAFPTADVTSSNGDVQYGATGLTKLEYLSALAMQGLLANPTTNNHDASTCDESGWFAMKSVRYAKALIAELEKHQ